MTPTNESSSPTLSTSPDPGTSGVNLRMLRIFSILMIPALASVLLLLVAIMVVAFIAVSHMNVEESSWPVILAIHLAQVGIGMVLGFVCLFLGTAMCWFGVTGTYTLGAEAAGTKVNIQGAQVGIVLLVGGILLTALALNKTVQGSRTWTTMPDNAATAQAPVPPRNRDLPPTPAVKGSESSRTYGASQKYGS
jgi:hypothetical protein